MESEIIEGFRQMFVNEHRKPIVAIDFDSACAPGYDIPMADMSAVLDLVSDYPNQDKINIIYGIYRDDRQGDNVSISCMERAILQNEDCPVIMCLHGFMSGSNGAKQQQLQRHFYNKSKILRISTPTMKCTSEPRISANNYCRRSQDLLQ